MGILCAAQRDLDAGWCMDSGKELCRVQVLAGCLEWLDDPQDRPPDLLKRGGHFGSAPAAGAVASILC